MTLHDNSAWPITWCNTSVHHVTLNLTDHVITTLCIYIHIHNSQITHSNRIQAIFDWPTKHSFFAAYTIAHGVSAKSFKIVLCTFKEHNPDLCQVNYFCNKIRIWEFVLRALISTPVNEYIGALNERSCLRFLAWNAVAVISSTVDGVVSISRILCWTPEGDSREDM